MYAENCFCSRLTCAVRLLQPSPFWCFLSQVLRKGPPCLGGGSLRLPSGFAEMGWGCALMPGWCEHRGFDATASFLPLVTCLFCVVQGQTSHTEQLSISCNPFNISCVPVPQGKGQSVSPFLRHLPLLS